MNITQMPCSNFNPDSGDKTYIVIHGTAGGSSASGIGQFFIASEGGSNPVAAHYIIDQQGLIVQCVQEQNGAWANGSPEWNNKAISIEHVKASTDNSDVLTSIQRETSFLLVKDIISRHAIPAANILPHSAVFNTACPGPYPFAELSAFLEEKPIVPVVSDSHMVKAASIAWGSFYATNNIRTIPTISSGIAKWWLDDYYQGIFHGPPVTTEYDTVDWHGGAIIAQDFTGGTVTWINGQASWYPVQ